MRQLTFIWMLILAVFSLPANAQFKKPVGKQALPATGSHFQPAPLPPLRPSVPAGSSFGTSFRGNHSLGALPKPVAGAPALFAYVDAATGTPYAVSGKFIATKNTDREKVAEYLEAAAPVLKLNDPAQEFQISRIQEEANGYRHYFLKQVWKGVEVYGAEAVLHEKDGEFYLFNGRYFPSPLLPSVTPAISAAEALELVKADLRNTEPVKELTEWEQKLANYEGPLTKQVIWIESGEPGNARLAWEVEIVPHLAARYHYVVDAKTGQVLSAYNSICKFEGLHNHGEDRGETNVSPPPPPDGPAIANATDLFGVSRTINTYEKSNVFYLIDASRTMFKPAQSSIPDDPAGVILTLDALNTSPASNNFQAVHITSSNNAWNNAKAVSAHYNGGKAYEYFKITFGRESINGEGGNIISLINTVDENGEQMDNAFWSGAAMFYGNGNQGFVAPLCKSLDVAGHEMSHGVIQSTANLLYQDESGALNESFADVFGVMIDRDDWLLGDDVVNTSVFPSGALRNMGDPHNGGSSLADNGWQPAHYSERYSGSQDNGGVHINSGIVNKAFYLFATDPAVGKDKAEQVYYRALTQYLFKSAKFVDCRIAVIQAATDLYGAAVANVAANAFTAVGIGSGGGSDPQTDIDPNPGEDFVMMTDDNFSQLYIFAPDGTLVANPLTTTSPLSRPSITDDGTVAVFVASDQSMRAITIDWNTGQTNEQILSSDPVWRNVAVSRDGSRLVALTDDYDNLLWIYDFGLQQWQAFELYNPTTGQGGPVSGDVQYADVIEWDYTGEWVMYDALNAIPTTGVSDIEYWDISFVNVWDNSTGFFADGFTDKLFSLLPEDVSVGNPTFSKNSDYIIAFDYLDEFNNEYFLLGANIETGDVGTIFENSDLSWPNYSVDDQFMVFDAFDNAGTPVLAFVQLAANKITPAGSPFIFISNGRRGVWFANGQRILVGAEETVNAPEIGLSPNPVSDFLNVLLPSENGEAVLSVFDLSGRLFLQEKVNAPTASIPVSSLPAGMYFLSVESERGSSRVRFVKQ
ncbi:MAG: hypothetical protein CMN32_12100 [Saprospirales bacterium]|nr:hypothetical protein [Saprospirales bacterium]